MYVVYVYQRVYQRSN